MTGETPPAAGQDLLAVCQICLQLIADGDGAVWCRPEAATAERGDRGDQETWSSFTLEEMLAAPDERVHWRVTHERCEPATGYLIAVERIRTWPAYLHWTAHLMGKGWFASTNWDDLILDTLDPTSTQPGLRPATVRDLGHRSVGD
ncbi:hypothetical protein M8542_36660 [Amycolatopsis sp. OK19-0408]|uniref:Uncharacterized protein n=1 Tax=Amycolatopsis iheyensis TaxID=2945988 RepID=A0A9X2SN00_9PSEU|nr:hypothetical protein [Amycolatopsis iheyensis]MCR6488377.1 hypothetical protein [Amycolatopsis iheyensis]